MNKGPEEPTGRVRQSDIARHLGINASTVSRALRNDPRITAAMRKKVLSTAKKLGYRPDPATSALANYRWKSKPQEFSGVMAWITAGDSPEELRKKYPEYGLYWKGARACAERFGYRIEEFSIDERMPLSRLDKILYSRNVKGLLLPPENVMFHDWEKLHAGNYSIVRLSRSVQHIEAHLVTTNQTADGILASRKMHELGYRRVGFVGIKHKERLFYPGFAWGQQNQPDANIIPPLFLNEIPTEQHIETFSHWIRQYQPDGILEDFDGFYDLLDRAGFSVPDDFGIATQNTLRNPQTARIMQNLEEVGRVAMLMLISLIGDHDRGIPPISRQVLVKGQWVDGPTLPRVK